MDADMQFLLSFTDLKEHSLLLKYIQNRSEFLSHLVFFRLYVKTETCFLKLKTSNNLFFQRELNRLQSHLLHLLIDKLLRLLKQVQPQKIFDRTKHVLIKITQHVMGLENWALHHSDIGRPHHLSIFYSIIE